MRMTPLDIQNHRFGRRMRGYDREEVESFLRIISEDYESLLRENERLQADLRRSTARIDELSADEKTLKETLVNAQAMSEDMRQVAARESEVLLSEAEIRAEKILDASHRRSAQLAQDIREMRALRLRLGSALRGTIETHLALIEALEEDPASDPLADGKLAFLTPKESRETAPEAAADPAEGGGRS